VIEDVLQLNPAQSKAFKKLKTAYKECEQIGIKFANSYGNLLAFDGSLVKDYNDNSGIDGILVDQLTGIESMRIVNEWADDRHYIHLTKKGKKVFLDE